MLAWKIFETITGIRKMPEETAQPFGRSISKPYFLFRYVDIILFTLLRKNGLRYLRWGGDSEAVQPEKWQGVENCLGFAQNPPQRQVVGSRDGA
jgi:hypothetical protein